MRVLFSKKLIFISKPRCGSTSVRRFLDKYLNPDYNDFAVDVAGRKPGYHPHITAPCLLNQLSQDFKIDFRDYKIFTITRNPLDMLLSYYKFFKPDINGRYNYHPKYVGGLQDLNQWLVSGRVEMVSSWMQNSPKFVNTTDFSPLSLEAHIMNHESHCCVTNYFKIEDISSIQEWLSDIMAEKITLPCINSSQVQPGLSIPNIALARIKKCFPLESEIYSL